MSAAATRHRCGMPEPTHRRWATRSCSRWSPARTGAGATSTRNGTSSRAIDEELPPLAGNRQHPRCVPATVRRSDRDLDAGGARRAVDTGETLSLRVSNSHYFFVVPVPGKPPTTTTDDAGNWHVILVDGPGRFLGELATSKAKPRLQTAEAVEPCARWWYRPSGCGPWSSTIRRSVNRSAHTCYAARALLLIEEESGFRIIGSAIDPTPPGCENSARNRLPHRWIDLERDKHAERLLQRVRSIVLKTPRW